MKKIIVIGSGLGGLTAGNLLVQKGHQVTVFESHLTPGGYTAGFQRKGFYFESGTDAFEMSADVFRAMKDLGVLDKIGFVRLEPYRHVSTDFDGVPACYQDYKGLIYNAYASEKHQLDRYFAIVDRMYDTMKGSLSKGPIVKKLVPGLRLLPLYVRYMNITVPQFVGRYFSKSSPLYRSLCSIVPYPDASAINIGGAFWTIYHDYWTVKGGMQSWADALATNFKQLGGDLRLRAKVERILTKTNMVRGVVCNGETYEADYVISACDYKQTFLELLDPDVVPTALVNKLRKASVSPGYAIVYLGLNTSNDALRQLMKSSRALCYDGTADVDLENSQDTAFFDHSRLSLYSPSLQNPDLTPAGKSSLMIASCAPYHWMNNWGNEDRAEYRQLKSRMRETLIRRASRLVPNLSRLIEFQDAATPLTFERYTHNTDGATNAWGMNPQKKFYRNSMICYVTTPIKNLFIGSSWATQVGGVPFAIKAGQRCAQLVGK